MSFWDSVNFEDSVEISFELIARDEALTKETLA